MKDFNTSAKAAAKKEEPPQEPIKFKLDDFELTAFAPTEPQVVSLMVAEGSDSRTESQRIAGFVDFALAIFEEDSYRHLTRRLLSREDAFDHEDLADIIMSLIEEFAQRPTKPSSDSTTSQGSGGGTSTAISSAEASTSTASPQLQPAT